MWKIFKGEQNFSYRHRCLRLTGYWLQDPLLSLNGGLQKRSSHLSCSKCFNRYVEIYFNILDVKLH